MLKGGDVPVFPSSKYKRSSARPLLGCVDESAPHMLTRVVWLPSLLADSMHSTKLMSRCHANWNWGSGSSHPGYSDCCHHW